MDLCRLCGNRDSLEPLSSLSDPELLIELKLERVFNVKLDDNKMLSQLVCVQCISHIESGYAFLERLEETQVNLTSDLNEQLSFSDDNLFFPRDIKVEQTFTTGSADDMPSTWPQLFDDPIPKPPRKRRKHKDEPAPAPVKTLNATIRMEDVFAKELNEGVFEAIPEILDVDETEQNLDGTLNDEGLLKATQLGWLNYNWKCVECRADFGKRKEYEEHFQSEHKKCRLKYACMDCRATFKTYLAFHRHVIEVHKSYMKVGHVNSPQTIIFHDVFCAFSSTATFAASSDGIFSICTSTAKSTTRSCETLVCTAAESLTAGSI